MGEHDLELCIHLHLGMNFDYDHFQFVPQIQIKQIQAELLALEITETITQPAEAVEPTPEVPPS